MAHIVHTGFEYGLAKASIAIIQAMESAASTRYNYGSCIRLNIGDSLVFNSNAGVNHSTIIAGTASIAPSGYPGGIMGFYGDAGGTPHIALTHNTDGTVSVRRGIYNGTILGTTTQSFPYNIWHYWEMKVTLHDTTGSVVVRLNNQTVLNLTNIDTKNGGTGSVIDYVHYYTSAVHGVKYDDIYINDGSGSVDNDFWGDIAIKTLVANGAGNSTQLTSSTGANWSTTDEAFNTTPNTTDYVGASTPGLKDTYSLVDLPAGTPLIKYISVGLYAAKSDAGSISARRVLRVNSTDYTGSDLVLAASYQWFWEYIRLSPNTSLAWTKAEIDAMEAGMEVRT
jgi:hypothetical protein